MEKKNKEKKTKVVFTLLFAVFGLVGVAIGMFLASFIEKSTEGQPSYEKTISFAVLLISIYIWFFVHIIIHEAGHLVFGLFSGYKFSSFRVGSFMIIKQEGKLKFKRQSIAGTGGQCLMVPPLMKDGKIPVILFNLGGSLMNLIATIIAVIVLILGYGVLKSYLIVSIITFILLGGLLFLTNALPISSALISNDGCNAIALSKNKEAMFSFWVQLMVMDMQSKGIRLKDMPDEWFYIPSDEAMKNSMVSALGVLTCNRLMDQEKFTEADRIMAHILSIKSGIVGIYRHLLICDRIYIELINENRRNVVAAMYTEVLKKIMKSMKKSPSVLRTEYSLALLYENDRQKAEKIEAEFKKVSSAYPYQNDILVEWNFMMRAKKLYQSNTKDENVHAVFM